MQPALEVADIFRHHGAAYRAWPRSSACPTLNGESWPPSRHVGRPPSAAMSNGARTVASPRIAYNSCRNRHCPKCQGLARASGSRPACRAAASPLLPRGVHYAGADCRHRATEQSGRLRYPVQGGGRHHACHRCRSTPPWCRNRHDRRAAHLGAEPVPPPAPALHRARWRPVTRRPLGHLPPWLLRLRPRALPPLPPAIPRTPAGRLPLPAD